MKSEVMKDELVEELQRLFTFVPPSKLQKELLEVFFYFLQREKDSLPDDIQEMATDFYFLLKFLEKAESIKKEK